MKVLNSQPMAVDNNNASDSQTINLAQIKIKINHTDVGAEVVVLAGVNALEVVDRYLLSKETSDCVLEVASLGAINFNYREDLNDRDIVTVSGDFASGVEITSNGGLDLQNLTTNNLQVKAAQIYADTVASNDKINLKAPECVLWGEVAAKGAVVVDGERVYQSNAAPISAKHVAITAKDDLRLDGDITADKIDITSLGEINYDIYNLLAKESNLNLNKVSQLQFPHNITTSNGDLRFINKPLTGMLNYNLIGNDVSDIHITQDCYLDGCSLKAKQNRLIVGSKQMPAHMLGNNLRLEVKDLDVVHGGLYSRGVLLVDTGNAKVGSIDFNHPVGFGQHLPHLPAYIGAHKIFKVNATQHIKLEQAQVIVDGVMYLRAPSMVDVSSSVFVGKDAYIDIVHQHTQIGHAHLATGPGTRYGYTPSRNHHKAYKIVERAVQAKTPPPLWMIDGVLHRAKDTTLGITGGVVYAKRIINFERVQLQNIEQILLESVKVLAGHKKERKSRWEDDPQQVHHYVNYPGALCSYENAGHKGHAMLARVILGRQYYARLLINRFILHDVGGLDRIKIANAVYNNVNNQTLPEEQDYIDASMLAEVIRGQKISFAPSVPSTEMAGIYPS